jgi:hypothetical protein
MQSGLFVLFFGLLLRPPTARCSDDNERAPTKKSAWSHETAILPPLSFSDASVQMFELGMGSVDDRSIFGV